MTFKVEDGTGLPDATSYVDVLYADAYFERSGFTAWASMDELKKQIALENGTEYADLRWGSRLKGTLLKLTQSLQFPRKQITDRYGRPVAGVPIDWKKAVCEYAMQSTKGSLISDAPSKDANLKKKKTVVGPITTEKEFEIASQVGSFPSFPRADAFVKPYLGSNFGANGGKVMRN